MLKVDDVLNQRDKKLQELIKYARSIPFAHLTSIQTSSMIHPAIELWIL